MTTNGRTNNKNAERNCLTIFGRFNSMIDHILNDELLPLLKTGYLSLT